MMCKREGKYLYAHLPTLLYKICLVVVVGHCKKLSQEQNYSAADPSAIFIACSTILDIVVITYFSQSMLVLGWGSCTTILLSPKGRFTLIDGGHLM